MTNKIFRFLKWESFCILSLLLVTSCIIDKNDENFISIDQNPNLEYSSVLTYRFDGDSLYPIPDTILMPQTADIEFIFPDGIIYGYDIYVDDRILISGEGSSIALNAAGLKKGNQTLVINQFAKSGTGSIADKYNLEYAIYSDTVNMNVLSVMPIVPNFLYMTDDEGLPKFNWDKPYNGAGFHRYIISGKYVDTDGPEYERIIPDKNTIDWVDRLNFGVNATYTLKVDIGGIYLESESFEYKFDYEPGLAFKKISESNFIVWNQPPFKKNISHYSIYKNSELLSESSNVTDTSVLINFTPVLGQAPPTLSLTINSVADESDNQFIHTYSQKVGLGVETPPQNTVIHNPINKNYYLLFSKVYYNEKYDGGIYELDSNLMVTSFVGRQSRAYEDHKFIMSPDGKSLYHYEFVTITKIDMNTLEPIKSIRTSGHSFGEKWRFSASNNGLVTSYEDNYDRSFEVYNFHSGRIVFDSARYTGSSHISTDGKILLLKNRIYSRETGGFKHTWSIDIENINYSRFINDENDMLLITDSEIITYSLQSKIVLKSFHYNIPNESKIFYEPSKMQIGYRASDGWVVIDINKQQILDMGRTVGGIDFTGDFLFSRNGYALKVNEE